MPVGGSGQPAGEDGEEGSQATRDSSSWPKIATSATDIDIDDKQFEWDFDQTALLESICASDAPNPSGW